MRVLASLVFTSFIFLSSVAQVPNDGPNKFAIKLLKEVSNSDKNTFISPISIFEVLCLLELGSKDRAQLEIADVLELPQDNRIKAKYLQDIHITIDDLRSVSFANSLWFNHTVRIEDVFNKQAKSIFNSNLEKVDFEQSQLASQQINEWVRSKTAGKIDKLFSAKDVFGASLVIANAIYFKSNWLVEFPERNTHQDIFKSESGEEFKVMYMSQEGLYSFQNYQGNQAIEIPYLVDNISLFAILPQNGKFIEEVVTELDYELLRHMFRDKGAINRITLEIPKFKIEYEIDLVLPLVNLRIKEIFGLPDFSGIGNSIDQIKIFKQKSILEVNEKGSEAAAVTGVVAARSMNLFTLNRPFLFFIVHKTTGLILFEGIIYNPK
jgi:serine protease inhibitor